MPTKKKHSADPPPLSWSTTKVKLGDLLPWEPNPRQSTAEQAGRIERSIKKFGYSQLIEVEPGPDGDLVLVDGHQRTPVMKLLRGFGPDAEIEARIASRPLTLDERKEYIALKHRGAVGEWNPDQFLNLYTDPQELMDFGFEQDELKRMGYEFASPQLQDREPSLDQALEFQAKWQVESGDLWRLGDHRIYCGDSTSREDVARLFRGEQPGIMVTDPPYGVDYDPAWRAVLDADLKRDKKVENDDRASWAMAYNLFPGDVAYVWHAGKYASIVERSLESCGFEIRSQIIWIKKRFAVSRGHYHWRHEPCWYAVRKGSKASWAGSRKQATVWADIVDHFAPDLDLFAARVDESTLLAFDSSLSTVWEIPGDHEDMDTPHSTQKPLECMARPIRNHKFTLVYDPFLGSGTTVIAAEELGVRALGMQLTPEFVAVALERFSRAFPALPVEKLDPR